jgi:hypothetical protein
MLLFSFKEFYLRNELDDNGIMFRVLAGLNTFFFLQIILDRSGACPRAKERERASDNSLQVLSWFIWCRALDSTIPDMLSGFAQGKTCFLPNQQERHLSIKTDFIQSPSIISQ